MLRASGQNLCRSGFPAWFKSGWRRLPHPAPPIAAASPFYSCKPPTHPLACNHTLPGPRPRSDPLPQALAGQAVTAPSPTGPAWRGHGFLARGKPGPYRAAVSWAPPVHGLHCACAFYTHTRVACAGTLIGQRLNHPRVTLAPAPELLANKGHPAALAASSEPQSVTRIGGILNHAKDRSELGGLVLLRNSGILSYSHDFLISAG